MLQNGLVLHRLLQRSGSGRLETPVIYKRLVIMLRSLYSKSRMMPGYALHSALKRRAGAPGLACTLHAPADGAQLADAVPGGMATFDFTPIETPVGYLFFLAFIFLIVVVMMNLLNGLVSVISSPFFYRRIHLFVRVLVLHVFRFDGLVLDSKLEYQLL